MADFNELESKLADWFKYVDRQAEAVKHAGDTPEVDEEEPKRIISKTPVPEEPEAVDQIEEQDSVVVERPRLLGQRRTPPPEILEEPEVPDIEDFLPFLKDRREESSPEPEAKLEEEKPAPKTPEPKMSAPPSTQPVASPKPPVTRVVPPATAQEPPVTRAERPATPPEPPVTRAVPPVTPAVPKPPASGLEPGQPEPENQRTLFFSEGTGTPRPRPRVREQPPEQPEQQSKEELADELEDSLQAQAIVLTDSPDSSVEKPEKVRLSTEKARETWQELPMHIKLLLEPEKKEVTQNSYKEFKETRQELIQRLLDPSLSLEEVARILNVCPTTVRRYTNRELLPHFRTAGNQRRFRLSDVLAFLESNYRGMPEA